MSRRVVVTTSVIVGVLAALVPVSAAGAKTAPTTVAVSAASWTPWLLSTTPSQNVRQLVQCGNVMYAVGTITAIGQGSTHYSRSNAFSFSATTGAVTAWAPQVSGTVNSVVLSPDCRRAYLGGSFKTVNGVAAKNIVAVNATTGAVLTGFARNASAEIDTLQYTQGLVLAGGTFTWINGAARTRLASLNPTTGAVTSYANLDVSGTYPGSTTRIYNSQISHAGTRMLVEGVFTSLGGQAHRQVAVLDLGPTAVTVDRWNAPDLTPYCDIAFYAKAAAWSPDDATVYVATTGQLLRGSSPRGTPNGLCDVVAAFPATSGTVATMWRNYTGCDSLYSVAADAANVYVSGHERWANNPQACEKAGPGAVNRQGLSSINPTTGMATSWNPGRSRGHGGDDMLLTTAGLWVASDNWSDGSAQHCGKLTNRGGICFLPY